MGNFIEIYENALSDKTCDYIMNCFEEFKDHLRRGRTGNGVDRKKKDSADLNLLRVKSSLSEFIFDEFQESLKKNIDKYQDKYKLTSPTYDSIWDKDFYIYPYAILAKRYTKNVQGYHIFHSDYGPTEMSRDRQLVCMYYLNDVEEGGETEFYHQDLKVKPTKGSLVIFPAAFTHLHKGHIPVSNDKYILNFWLMRGQPKIMEGIDIEKQGFTLNKRLDINLNTHLK
jgi:hypothetical protein